MYGLARLSASIGGSTLVLLAGCVGEIGGSGQPSAAGGSATMGGPNPPGSTPTSCETLGARPLARLARQEYLNTVVDLFQIAPPAMAALPEDGDFGGFKTTAGQTLNAPVVEKYVDLAASIASSLVLDQARVFGCAGQEETTCIANFLGAMGPRLFRRPLLPTETAHYQGLFSTIRATASFDQAASVLLQALLLAPQFLFHIEQRQTGQVEGQPYALDDFQLAARLSYLFWRTTPDAELSDLAARATLHDPAVLGAQVERLMSDPRAKPVMRSFLSQWLKLENIERIMVDPVKEPDYTPARLSVLAEETRSFVEGAFWSSSNTLGDLLVTAQPTEQAFGLLSQPGFLAAISRNQEADIIYRGRFVREKLLCQQLSLPPPNLASPLPEVTAGMTGRQRVTEHTSAPACMGCHQLMNPIGFTLEHFDYLGRWRELDHDLPIDTSASLGDPLGDVSSALELSRRLAESDAVALCGAQQAFEFAVGHAPAAEDACTLEALVAANPRDLRGILRGLPLSRAFLYRLEPQP
jgi:hypothetical protein